MRKLDFLGELFYGVHRDFNGNPHWRKKTARVGFLYGTAPLEQLRTKQVALLGVGEHSFWCTELLRRNGIEVAAYCDNDPQLVGQTLNGHTILSPFDLFQREGIHLIAAPDKEQFEAIADQFSHCGVNSYSFFFHVDTVIDYKDAQIRDVVLRSINILLGNEYGAAIHKNAPLHITMRLLPGLEWWSEELYWLREDLGKGAPGLKVLDIGPGFGFVSTIIKQLRPDCELHWLSLAVEDGERQAYIDQESKQIPITQKYGMIEDPAYQIEERYDAIIMTEVFEHFGCAPDITLKKIAGMLNEGGKIYLSTPNWEKENLYRSWRDIPPFGGDRAEYARRNKSRIDWMDLNLKHAYIYTQEELEELFACCGLRPVRFVINACNNFNCVLEKIPPQGQK